MNRQYKYFAFISYKREDERWAKWLQRRLDYYRLPSSIGREHSDVPKRLFPVFSDMTDIQPGVLKSELESKLDESGFLIVICSPRSAQSNWVGREIKHFISLGRQDNIILFVIEGKPYSNDPATECVHPVVKQMLPEMLAVNINEKGDLSRRTKRERALIQTVSRMLNVEFDTLWQRQRRRMIRNIVLTTLAAVAAVVCVALAWYANTPFDSTIALTEQTAHNPALPFDRATIRLLVGRDTVTKQIETIDEAALFRNIPRRYLYRLCRLWFESSGYRSIDTTIVPKPHTVLSVGRDDTYALFKGLVIDERGNRLEGVTIAIDSLTTLSRADGTFCIAFPLEAQTPRKHITASKSGFKSWEFDGAPSKKYNHKILMYR